MVFAVPESEEQGFEDRINKLAKERKIHRCTPEEALAFVKTCAAEPGGFMRRQLVICGEKGTIEIYPLEAYAGDKAIGRRDISTTMRQVNSLTDENGYHSVWNDVGESKKTELFNRYDAMM